MKTDPDKLTENLNYISIVYSGQNSGADRKTQFKVNIQDIPSKFETLSQNHTSFWNC